MERRLTGALIITVCLGIAACGVDPSPGGDGTGGGSSATASGGGTGTPGGDDAGTPGGDDAGMPGGDDAGTPGGDDAGMPGGDDAGTPGGDDAGMPGGDDAGTPGGDDAGTPDAGAAGPWVSDLWEVDATRPAMTKAALDAYALAHTAPQGECTGTFVLHARTRICPGACDVWNTWSPVALGTLADPDSPLGLPSAGNVCILNSGPPSPYWSSSQILAARITDLPNGYLYMLIVDDGGQGGESLGASMGYRTLPEYLPFTPDNILTVPVSHHTFQLPPGTPELNLGVPASRLISLHGRIFADGTIHLVTGLGPAGTGIGTHQLAVVGTLGSP